MSILGKLRLFYKKRRGSLAFLCLGLILFSSVFFALVFSDTHTLADIWQITVYAQSTDEGVSDFMGSIIDILQALLQIIYIIMWPLLFIAGLALDNTLVYGEFINLDGILWTFWKISQNLANFALGGLVLFEVIKYVFLSTNSNLDSVYKVLQGSLIAGIGIQVSWILIAVLIDISTILIVALGGLPLTLMDQFAGGDQPILGVKGHINVNDNTDGAFVYYQWGDNIFPQCRTTEKYVVGPVFTGIINDNLDFTQSSKEKKYCSFGPQKMVNITAMQYNSDVTAYAVQQLIKYEGLKDIPNPTGADKAFVEQMEASNATGNVQYYLERANGIVNTVPGRTADIATLGQIDILEITDKEVGIDWKKEFVDKPDIRGQGRFLSDIMTESRNFVGPMVTLYVTLLDFSNLHTTAIGTGEEESGMAFFFEFFLKAVVGIMLIVPLIMLTVVLIIRIGVLRLVIAFSPFLALVWGFGKDWAQKISSKISRQNIVGLIFAPVLPVFVLGISIIFLQALSQKFYDPQNVGSWESFGISITHQTDEQISCAKIRGAMEFCYESQSDDTGNSIYANLFAWILVNMFAIGLVWTLITLSLKGNEFTKGAASKIASTAGSIVGNLPIIPLPGVGAVTANAASQITGIGNRGPGIIGRRVNEYFDQQTRRQVDDFLGRDNDSGKKEFSNKEAKYWSGLANQGSATAQGIFQATGDYNPQTGNINEQYVNANLSDYSEKSQKVLLDGFGNVIKSSLNTLDDTKKTPTKENLDETVALLNSSIGQEYLSNNNVNQANKTFEVKEKDGSTARYILKETNKLFSAEPVNPPQNQQPNGQQNPSQGNNNATGPFANNNNNNTNTNGSSGGSAGTI